MLDYQISSNYNGLVIRLWVVEDTLKGQKLFTSLYQHWSTLQKDVTWWQIGHAF